MADTDWLLPFAPGIVALGWTLIDVLWQGALVAVAYALARALLPTPRARLAAGHAALLLLAVLPTLTLLAHLGLGGVDPTPAPISAGVSALAASFGGDAAAGAALPSWLSAMVAAWMLGVSLISARLWREWHRLQCLCRDADALPAEWQRRFAQLQQRLGITLKVRLLQGARVATPMLIGVLRPTVLLPASLVARLPADQLELILVHELAHLRRLDPLFNLLQTALDTLLFYHPAVHWISRRVREDRELCCDDVVVASGGDRLRYARALLALAERHALDASVPALAASGGVLLERVERIVAVSPAPRRQGQALVLASLGVLLALLWWLPSRERALEEMRRGALPLAIAAWPVAQPIAPMLELAIGDIDGRPVSALPTLRAAAPVDVAQAEGRTAEASPLRIAVQPFAPPVPAAVVAPTPTLDLAHAAPPSLRSTPRALDAAPSPTPLQRVAPNYPRSARLDGVQGWVVLAYVLDAEGGVAAIEVVDSQPRGVFDVAAERALQRWRYAADAAGMRLTQRFDFVLPADEVALMRTTDRCLQHTGSRVCRPVRARLPGSSLSAD